MTDKDFETAFASFFEGVKQISLGYFAKQYPNVKPDEFSFQRLQKRIRIVRAGACHCFVDLATGDVLMGASWKAPAKHARGNIFDEKNGLGSMGPYGPAYLR